MQRYSFPEPAFTKYRVRYKEYLVKPLTQPLDLPLEITDVRLTVSSTYQPRASYRIIPSATPTAPCHLDKSAAVNLNRTCLIPGS